MRKQTMNRTKVLLAATMLCGCASLQAQAAPGCSLASLSGNYGFTLTGQILAGPTAGPAAGVALTPYGGNGGPPPPPPGAVALILGAGAPTVNLHMVVDQLLGQIRTVVDGDVAITSIGARQVMAWSLLFPFSWTGGQNSGPARVGSVAAPALAWSNRLRLPQPSSAG